MGGARPPHIGRYLGSGVGWVNQGNPLARWDYAKQQRRGCHGREGGGRRKDAKAGHPARFVQPSRPGTNQIEVAPDGTAVSQGEKLAFDNGSGLLRRLGPIGCG